MNTRNVGCFEVALSVDKVAPVREQAGRRGTANLSRERDEHLSTGKSASGRSESYTTLVFEVRWVGR